MNWMQIRECGNLNALQITNIFIWVIYIQPTFSEFIEIQSSCILLKHVNFYIVSLVVRLDCLYSFKLFEVKNVCIVFLDY